MVDRFDCVTLEDGTDRFSRNVGMKLAFYAASNPKRGQIATPYHYGCKDKNPFMKVLFLVGSNIVTYLSKVQFNNFLPFTHRSRTWPYIKTPVGL
jgi:hypothetical protein